MQSGGARECQYHIQNIFFLELSKYYLSQRSQQFPSRKKQYFFYCRRKHGMGLLGKVMRKKRLTRRMPESSRKRKLGGNSRDHRPYFTYWVTFVQAAILFISLLLYGFGPLGVDLYKRSNMVSAAIHRLNYSPSSPKSLTNHHCCSYCPIAGASDESVSGEHRIPGAG